MAIPWTAESITNKVISGLPNGWLKVYCERSSALTDAPASFHLVAGLTVLSAVAPVDMALGGALPEAGMHFNMWGMVVGDQGDSRKTTSLRLGMKLLREADPERVGQQPGSAEGFVESLAQQPQQLLYYGDLGQLFQATQARRGGNYFSQLKGFLLPAFDCERISRRTKRGIDLVEEPRLSMLGGVNRPIIEQNTDPEDYGSGLMSRWFIMTAQRERTYGSIAAPNPQVEEWLQTWLASAAGASNTASAWGPNLGLTRGAEKRLNAYQAALGSTLKALPYPDRSIGPHARSRTYVIKIAGLIAWSTGKGWGTPGRPSGPWRINETEMKAAIQIAIMGLGSAIMVCSSVSSSIEMQQRQQVLDAIAQDWTDEHLILRSGRVLKRRAQEILETLLAEKVVERRYDASQVVRWRRSSQFSDARGVEEAGTYVRELVREYQAALQHGVQHGLQAPQAPMITLPPLPGAMPSAPNAAPVVAVAPPAPKAVTPPPNLGGGAIIINLSEHKGVS